MRGKAGLGRWSLGVVGSCLVAALWATTSVFGQTDRTFVFTGEVTEVTDELGWFNGLLNVGTPITGQYTFSETSHDRLIISGDPTRVSYQSTGKAVSKVPAVIFTIGNNAKTPLFLDPESAVPYQINLGNDATPFGGGGPVDQYSVFTGAVFPPFFHDFTGDPVHDPDGFFFPLLSMGLNLTDPTATALSGLGLPLTPPNLQSFADRRGSIVISDGNGAPDYATARFSITSLAVVPEPITWGLAVGVVAVVGAMGRKRRNRHSRLETCPRDSCAQPRTGERT